MKKKLIYITALCITGYAVYGQTNIGNVGINTKTPRTTLDINGKTNINGPIELQGSDTAKGDAGKAESNNSDGTLKEQDFITADEQGRAVWKNFAPPKGLSTDYVPTLLLASTDDKGIDVKPGDNIAALKYQEESAGVDNDVNIGMSSTSNDNFVLFKEDQPVHTNKNGNLGQWIEIKKAKNKVDVTFQAMVQANYTQSNTYACGIFVDDKLRIIRSDAVNQSGAYGVFTLFVTFANDISSSSSVNSTAVLSPGWHKINVGCIRRSAYNSGGTNLTGPILSVGKPAIDRTTNAGYDNLNLDMAKASLVTFVSEEP